jgi:hypothetical protein
MAHIFFEEEQRLTNIWWLWVAIFVLIMVPLVSLIILSEEAPDKDKNMLLLAAFGIVPFAFLMIYVRFQVRVDKEGLHYKFFPIHWNWKNITLNEIQSIDFEPKVNFIDRISIGHQLNRFTNTLRLNITGKSFIIIYLNSGRKLLVGTENVENMTSALKRLTKRTEE